MEEKCKINKKQKKFNTNKFKKAYCHLLEGSHTDFGQWTDFPPMFFYRDKERSQIKLPNPKPQPDSDACKPSEYKGRENKQH